MKREKQGYNYLKRPKKVMEPMDGNGQPIEWGDYIVDTSGAIPDKIRIEEMMMAGRKLATARKEQYDTFGRTEEDEENPIPVVPITRRRNIDTFQVMNAYQAVDKKLKDQMKTKRTPLQTEHVKKEVSKVKEPQENPSEGKTEPPKNDEKENNPIRE